MTVDLTSKLKAEAERLGFDLVGIALATAPASHPLLIDWLEAGCAAGMDYMQHQAEPRRHPESILSGVKTVVMVGFVYGEPSERDPTETEGKVARYAQGADYHQLLWGRLGKLLRWIKSERPGIKGRAVADSAPLLERDFAQRAGLGWLGKNTMLIHPRLGSFTVLGALLLDEELTPDEPFVFDRCGTCTRCLDACPTDAFDGPHRLDARKCISYWTIEHRGDLPESMADHLDGWAFGCDVCQDVCPWNRKAPPTREPALKPRGEWTNPDLVEWLEINEEAWAQRLRGSALRRTKRVGLVRNACLILGTRRLPKAIPALRRLLTDDDETIRSAAAWALGRINGQTPPSRGPAEVSHESPIS